MGAKILHYLTDGCSHLVFKDGSLSTYNAAKDLRIHIVSVSWIEACRKEDTRLPEVDYPCCNHKRYDSARHFPNAKNGKSFRFKDEKCLSQALDTKANRISRSLKKVAKKVGATRTVDKQKNYKPFAFRVSHALPDYPNNFSRSGTIDGENKIQRNKRIISDMHGYEKSTKRAKIANKECTKIIPHPNKSDFKPVLGSNVANHEGINDKRMDKTEDVISSPGGYAKCRSSNNKNIHGIKAICLRILGKRSTCYMDLGNIINKNSKRTTIHSPTIGNIEAEIIRTCAEILGYKVQ